MCGILGWSGFQPSEKSIAEGLGALRHRGPDNDGLIMAQDRTVGLGHRRLAINDLSDAGKQPICAHNLSLVCNGQIYNAPALRKELEALGYHFSSNNDNEVIIHGYHYWKDDVFIRLHGMFALAIWDKEDNSLLLARDGIGIKPLSIIIDGTTIAFASEAGALLSLLPSKPRINPFSIAYLLSIGYVPAPHSIWNGVQKLEPGHYLKWRNDKVVEKRCFWEPPREIKNVTDPEEIASLLDMVIKDHMLSDVPIGLFLSGGLDSTAVALGVSKQNTPIEAFSLEFSGDQTSELQYAKKTANHLKIPHNGVSLDAIDIPSLLMATMRCFDEPQGYGGLLPLMAISNVVSKRYRCVLSGDGGDEVFRGYRWHFDLQQETGLKRHINRLRRCFLDKGDVSRSKFLQFSEKSVIHRHAMRQFPRFLPDDVSLLLSPHDMKFDDDAMLAPFHQHYSSALPLARALQRVDLMTFCSGSILPKVDRASMAHSLEVRVPLLDRRLISAGLQLNIHADEERGISKPPIRRYLSGHIPDSILNHPKRGFSLTNANQLDYSKLIESIGNSSLIKDQYLHYDWKKMLAPNSSWRDGQIFALFALSCWYQNWVGHA